MQRRGWWIPMFLALVATQPGCGGSSEARADPGPDPLVNEFRLAMTSLGDVRRVDAKLVQNEVIEEPTDPPSHYVLKRPGAGTIAPICLDVGFGSDASVYRWIADTLQGNDVRQAGALRFADPQGGATGGMLFTDAALTEITFPTMDVDSQAPAALGLKIMPGNTQVPANPPPPSQAPPPTHRVLASGFRLEIDGFGSGLDVRTMHVYRGAQPLPPTVPVAIELGELRLHVGTGDLHLWAEWVRQHLDPAVPEADKERSARICYLDADTGAEVARLELQGVGIRSFGFAAESVGAGAGAAGEMVVELYVEQASFWHSALGR